MVSESRDPASLPALIAGTRELLAFADAILLISNHKSSFRSYLLRKSTAYPLDLELLWSNRSYDFRSHLWTSGNYGESSIRRVISVFDSASRRFIAVSIPLFEDKGSDVNRWAFRQRHGQSVVLDRSAVPAVDQTRRASAGDSVVVERKSSPLHLHIERRWISG